MNINKLIPFIVLAALIALLWRGLFYTRPNEIPSPLINDIVPTFQLTTLDSNPNATFTNKELKGNVKLVTFWATWCSACDAEHTMLMKISNEYNIPIYGILYKDNTQDALSYLAKNGNPYIKIGNDANGDVGIDFGVYGTPQTYIINRDGKIIYRQIGAITEATWKNTLLPIVQKNS